MRATSVALRVVSVATAAMAATPTAKIAAGALPGVPYNAALEQVIMGLALAFLAFSCTLSFWADMKALLYSALRPSAVPAMTLPLRHMSNVRYSSPFWIAARIFRHNPVQKDMHLL